MEFLDVVGALINSRGERGVGQSIQAADFKRSNDQNSIRLTQVASTDGFIYRNCCTSVDVGFATRLNRVHLLPPSCGRRSESRTVGHSQLPPHVHLCVFDNGALTHQYESGQRASEIDLMTPVRGQGSIQRGLTSEDRCVVQVRIVTSAATDLVPRLQVSQFQYPKPA